MFVFGQVPAGFAQVEAPVLYCTAVNGLAAGSSFVNVADVGGVYNGQWVQAVTRWVIHGLWQAHPAPPHWLLIHTLGVHSSGWTPFPYTLKYNIL